MHPVAQFTPHEALQLPVHPFVQFPVHPPVQPEPHPLEHEAPQVPQEEPQVLEQEPVHPPTHTEPHPATHKPEQEPLQLEEEASIGSASKIDNSSSARSKSLSTVPLIAANELSSIKSWTSNNKSLIFST